MLNPHNHPSSLTTCFSRLALPLTLDTGLLQGGPHTYLGGHQAEPGLQVVNKHPTREEEEANTQ